MRRFVSGMLIHFLDPLKIIFRFVVRLEQFQYQTLMLFELSLGIFSVAEALILIQAPVNGINV